MSDSEEIRKLIARYAQSIDDGRFDELASLFTADGEWVTPAGTSKGQQEIRGFISSFESGRATDVKSKHLALNNIIDVDGDTASAWSDFIVVQSGPAGGTIARAGRYEDTFAKVDGSWRFARRVHHSSAWNPSMVMAGDEQ